MDLNDVYKNLNKEVSKLNLAGKKPTLVCDRLRKLYDHGKEAKLKMKLQDAYLYFKRWILCVEWLQSQRLDENFVEIYFSKKKIEDVKKLLSEVSNGIDLEFNVQKSVSHKYSINKNTDISQILPEIPNCEPQNIERHEITCSELFQILDQNKNSNDKRILIIDVREGDDYFKSRISFENNIIHISAEKIKPNKTSDYYRSILENDKESADRFDKRSAEYTDVIVLVDWNSTLNTVKEGSPIDLFLKYFEGWDVKTKYKKISILKGGFNQWLNVCPTYVINSQLKKPLISIDLPNNLLDNNMPEDLSDDVFENISYNDLYQINKRLNASPTLKSPLLRKMSNNSPKFSPNFLNGNNVNIHKRKSTNDIPDSKNEHLKKYRKSSTDLPPSKNTATSMKEGYSESIMNKILNEIQELKRENLESRIKWEKKWCEIDNKIAILEKQCADYNTGLEKLKNAEK